MKTLQIFLPQETRGTAALSPALSDNVLAFIVTCDQTPLIVESDVAFEDRITQFEGRLFGHLEFASASPQEQDIARLALWLQSKKVYDIPACSIERTYSRRVCELISRVYRSHPHLVTNAAAWNNPHSGFGCSGTLARNLVLADVLLDPSEIPPEAWNALLDQASTPCKFDEEDSTWSLTASTLGSRLNAARWMSASPECSRSLATTVECIFHDLVRVAKIAVVESIEGALYTSEKSAPFKILPNTLKPESARKVIAALSDVAHLPAGAITKLSSDIEEAWIDALHRSGEHPDVGAVIGHCARMLGAHSDRFLVDAYSRLVTSTNTRRAGLTLKESLVRQGTEVGPSVLGVIRNMVALGFRPDQPLPKELVYTVDIPTYSDAIESVFGRQASVAMRVTSNEVVMRDVIAASTSLAVASAHIPEPRPLRRSL